jgi:hypothetical protein
MDGNEFGVIDRQRQTESGLVEIEHGSPIRIDVARMIVTVRTRIRPAQIATPFLVFFFEEMCLVDRHNDAQTSKIYATNTRCCHNLVLFASAAIVGTFSRNIFGVFFRFKFISRNTL